MKRYVYAKDFPSDCKDPCDLCDERECNEYVSECEVHLVNGRGGNE